MPGCSNISNIFSQEIPNIYFHQDFLNINCRISGDLIGYHMSNLLYIWGNLDMRTRPLIFAVIKWALELDLLENVQQQKFNEITLYLMVIFYLQNQHKILPPLDKLKYLAGNVYLLDRIKRVCTNIVALIPLIHS